MSTYPAGIWSPPTRVDATDDVTAVDFNVPAGEIVAVQTELGINPSGSDTDITARLARMETIGVAITRLATGTSDSGSSYRTLIGWDTTVYADSGFTVNLGAGTVTVPTTGWYMFEGHARVSGSTTGICFLTVSDGTTRLSRGEGLAATVEDISASGLVRVTAGTVLRLQAYTASTVAFVGDATGQLYYFRLVRL